MENWQDTIFKLMQNILSWLNLSMPNASDISLNNIIDILIVAYFIYKLLMWIKETRAWSLFRGVLVLTAAFVLSSLFQLQTVKWIIQNAFSMGIIAVIVLFQPEIRKFLEQIGKGKIALPFFMENDIIPYFTQNTINEVVKAITTMAAERCGALILLEKDVPLGDHEQTGISIDAVVSSQLLINIFVDKTPLHDGAVIIRNNRIRAASCILPLTQDEIGKELGTRHRAAVGASDVSDAIILVVSEESGNISAAVGGKLERGITEQRLTEILSESNVSARKRQHWREWISREKNS